MQRKLAEFFNLIFGFRKFLIMLFVIVLAIVFRIKDLINGTEMSDLLKATVISFFGANGVEHITTVVKGAMDARTAAMTPPEDQIAVPDEEDPKETIEST